MKPKATQYLCNKGHGGNTTLYLDRVAGRWWLWCAGCHTFYAAKDFPRSRKRKKQERGWS